MQKRGGIRRAGVWRFGRTGRRFRGPGAERCADPSASGAALPAAAGFSFRRCRRCHCVLEDAHDQSMRVPSAGIVIRAAARIEPHAAPGTMLCTDEFLSELDERSRSLFTPITQIALQGTGLLLGDDGIAVIRKNDQEEPIETRLFQAPLG